MKKTKYLIPIPVIIGLAFIIQNPRYLIPVIDKLDAIQRSWESWNNPLRKYGVFYSWDHGEHYEVTILSFWLQTDKGKIDGPSFLGDNLTMEFSRVGGDPIPEIVVSAKNDPSSRAVVKVIVEDGKAVRFHIVEANRIDIAYRAEGYD